MGRITASRKQLVGDPVYGSILASKFINYLMYDGKKSVAQQVFYDALAIIETKITDKTPIEVFTQAIENIKPNLEVRSKRVGGASFQVPMPVQRGRQQSLAIRWILNIVRSNGKKATMPTSKKLAIELIAAYNNEGAAIKKRDDVHRMADANKANAHYAW